MVKSWSCICKQFISWSVEYRIMLEAMGVCGTEERNAEQVEKKTWRDVSL